MGGDINPETRTNMVETTSPTPTYNYNKPPVSQVNSALQYGNAGGKLSNSTQQILSGMNSDRYLYNNGVASLDPKQDYSLGERDAFNQYQNTLDFDWAGGLDMLSTGVGTLAGIGSYFDTMKTNKLQRAALQGNIDTQNEERAYKQAAKNSYKSAFA